MKRDLRGFVCSLAVPLLALVLPMAPAAAATVPSADGVEIHYTVQGAGSPALVFVHGWSCDAGYWAAQMAHFSSDHFVVTIDLAGHGSSGQARAAYTMEAFGHDVAAVLAALDLEGAILVGHSMGGAVIVEAALAAPERVARLVGVDNFQVVNMTFSDEEIAGYLALFDADFAKTCHGWVKGMFPASADSALVERIASDMASAPPVVALSALRELLVWDGQRTSERLARLQVPLMCINSDAQPTATEPITALVPGYQLRLMPGRGHFLMCEDPERFNDLLAETIAALAPQK